MFIENGNVISLSKKMHILRTILIFVTYDTSVKYFTGENMLNYAYVTSMPHSSTLQYAQYDVKFPQKQPSTANDALKTTQMLPDVSKKNNLRKYPHVIDNFGMKMKTDSINHSMKTAENFKIENPKNILPLKKEIILSTKTKISSKENYNSNKNNEMKINYKETVGRTNEDAGKKSLTIKQKYENLVFQTQSFVDFPVHPHETTGDSANNPLPVDKPNILSLDKSSSNNKKPITDQNFNTLHKSQDASNTNLNKTPKNSEDPLSVDSSHIIPPKSNDGTIVNHPNNGSGTVNNKLPQESPVEKAPVNPEKPPEGPHRPAEFPHKSEDKPSEKPAEIPDKTGEKPPDIFHKPGEKPMENPNKPSERPSDNPHKPEEKPPETPNIHSNVSNKPEEKPSEVPRKNEENPTKPGENPNKPEERPNEFPHRPEEKPVENPTRPEKPPESPHQPGEVPNKPKRKPGEHEPDDGGTIVILVWRWADLGIFVTFTSFIVVTAIARVGFRHVHFLATTVPETCLMIGIGAAVGGILYYVGIRQQEDPSEVTGDSGEPTPPPAQAVFTLPAFTPELYFLVLVPPVVLEAAYTLHDRSFAHNLVPIVLYAIVGKLLNVFAIGGMLIVANKYQLMPTLKDFGEPVTPNYTLTLIDSLIFSTIVTGVDAAAVLPIFEEAGVNKDLYFLLLGESLLNDAVTTAMYSSVNALDSDHVEGLQYFLAVAAFFAVCFGGLLIGVIGGLITALLTRITNKYRVVEPLVVLGIAYLSYITAELVGFSGHVSIIGCGVTQAHYAFKNISTTSFTTVIYFTKMISSTSDSVIFLFLGMATITDIKDWHTGFVMWTLGLCFLVRFLVVFLLSGLYNLVNTRYIRMHDQIVIAYCGLRGAVCFCLAHMIDGKLVGPRELFNTTVIIVILWTVFVQGGTVKYLIDILDIELEQNGCHTLQEEVNNNVMNMIISGIEKITSLRGDNIISRNFRILDDNIFKKIFMTKNIEMGTQLFHKLEMIMSTTSLQKRPGSKDSNKSMKKDDKLSVRVDAFMPGQPTNLPVPRQGLQVAELRQRRRPTQVDPAQLDISMTLRQAMRNSPYRRMQYNNPRREVEEFFQAPPQSLTALMPQVQLRTGQMLLEMREVATHESPGLLAPNDVHRRLFVARMRMPPVPPREPLRLQGLPGFLMMQTPGAADGTPARPLRPSRRGDQPEQRPRKK